MISIHSSTESAMRIAPPHRMTRLHRSPTRLAWVDEYENFFIKSSVEREAYAGFDGEQIPCL
jgi:hypothetical protein